uniref:Uncharacterized protein n=1 Tax=Siphoviridae sp. ctMsr1 TaxID=2826264 RepID=A0A8S5LV77_9CAUD|nr:MAG TPA: hypothetical protein [Siphoviridae sp. ctMsr1]
MILLSIVVKIFYKKVNGEIILLTRVYDSTI